MYHWDGYQEDENVKQHIADRIRVGKWLGGDAEGLLPYRGQGP